MKAKQEGRNMRISAAMAWAIVLAGSLASGCLGEAEGPVIGSESHFLSLCDGDCGSGYDCISGVCTRGCLLSDEDSCSDLPQAICTNESIEPGVVAVCDAPCSGDTDCLAISPGHECVTGYCRLPAPEYLADLDYNFAMPFEEPVAYDQVRCTRSEQAPFLPTGELGCKLVEVELFVMGSGSPDCQAEGRRPASAKLEDTVRAFLNGDWCGPGTDSEDDCDDYKMCEIPQLEGAALQACYFDNSGPTLLEADGFCAIKEGLRGPEGDYVAGGTADGTSSFIQACPDGAAAAYRFLGAGVPRSGESFLYLACEMPNGNDF